MQVKASALVNGNVLVSKTYFDGTEMVTDTVELTAIGAYVYAINPNGTTSQVCEGLLPTGPTLMAGKNLLEVVNRTLGLQKPVNVTPYNYEHGTEFVNACDAVPTGNAFATSRVLDGSSDHGAFQEWLEPAVLPNGRKCHRVYLFDESDLQDDDGEWLEDASNFPWGDKNVARIKLAD